MSGISIIIAGDIVPTKSNDKLFASGDLDTLIGNQLIEVFNKSDYRIINLEVPLTDEENPIIKHGPNLRADTKTIRGIKAMKPSLINLANNHILDQGELGLLSTRYILNRNGIDTIGAGNSLFEASKPVIMEKEGIRVGVYACAEHEFSIAEEGKTGANPFDPFESLDHISNLNKSCDYVIVLYHGGKEEYPYPTPNLQKVCHAMAKKGADIILCQHSHCIGCYELYEKAYICYGQGNFLFDASEHELWKTGLILELVLDKDKININPIPIVKYGNKVRLAGPGKKKKILVSYTKRSVQILQPYFIEKEYKKKSCLKLDEYMNVFYGGNYLRRICKKMSRRKWSLRYSEKKLAAIENYIASEAHREMLLNGLKNYSKRRDQGENRKRFS